MKPRAYVFTGPTLARSNLTPPESIAFLPPAAQGDVYRVAQEKPVAIGIIDGYFEGRASIWHKEILWAMDQGIQVFGSASMGALRASELHPFGMQGIGKIFEAYRDGTLEDDDEVAVLHAPADAGFLSLSEPMVTIRATLEEAAKQDVIDSTTAKILERLAKETFYQERRWSDLLSKAEREDIAADAVPAFKRWLPNNSVDQKEIDAGMMIEAMIACLDRPLLPSPKDYHFEWTEMWDEVVRYGNARRHHHVGGGGDAAAVLEEARLNAGITDPIYRLALLRQLATTSHATGQAEQRLSETKKAFRERFGLFKRADLDQWQQQHHLDPEEFEQLMTGEARLEDWLYDDLDHLGRHILDQLRLDGRYTALAERAEAKQTCLKTIGQTDPSPTGFPLSPPELRAWYFEHRCHKSTPNDFDDYARSIGFEDHRSFDRALRREYLYVVGNRR